MVLDFPFLENSREQNFLGAAWDANDFIYKDATAAASTTTDVFTVPAGPPYYLAVYYHTRDAVGRSNMIITDSGGSTKAHQIVMQNGRSVTERMEKLDFPIKCVPGVKIKIQNVEAANTSFLWIGGFNKVAAT